MKRFKRKELIGKEMTIEELDKIMEDYTRTKGSIVRIMEDGTFYKSWDIEGKLIDSYMVIFKMNGINKIKIVEAHRV